MKNNKLTIPFPLCILRLRSIIFDKDCEGVIQSANVSDEIEKFSIFGNVAPAFRVLHSDAPSATDRITLVKAFLKFTIKCDNGKILTKRYRVKTNYKEVLGLYYKPGERVYWYKGTKCPKKEINTAQINGREHRLCVVCGNFAELERTKCWNCGSTIID
jgi:hypothetical protein